MLLWGLTVWHQTNRWISFELSWPSRRPPTADLMNPVCSRWSDYPLHDLNVLFLRRGEALLVPPLPACLRRQIQPASSPPNPLRDEEVPVCVLLEDLLQDLTVGQAPRGRLPAVLTACHSDANHTWLHQKDSECQSCIAKAGTHLHKYLLFTRAKMGFPVIVLWRPVAVLADGPWINSSEKISTTPVWNTCQSDGESYQLFIPNKSLETVQS